MNRVLKSGGLLIVLLVLALLNMRALIGPFAEPKESVRIYLANCSSMVESECFIEGAIHYEFFKNDTFITDSRGNVTRLRDDEISSQTWASGDVK